MTGKGSIERHSKAIIIEKLYHLSGNSIPEKKKKTKKTKKEPLVLSE